MPEEYDNNVINIDFGLRKEKREGKESPVDPPVSLPEDVRELIFAAQAAAVALDMIAWEEDSPGAGDRAAQIWAAIERIERNADDD